MDLIYNIHTDKLKKLADEKVMYATFSPQGDKIAYVLDNTGTQTNTSSNNSTVYAYLHVYF